MSQNENNPNRHPLADLYTPEIKARFERIHNRPVAIEVNQLRKTYYHKKQENLVLGGIDFNAYQREFMCVVGPSGCGKSTLARTIAGLETHDSGDMIVAGSHVSGPGPDRGMVFQKYTLFPWMSVKKNVMFGLVQSGQDKADAERDALQWIDLVGLSKYADSYPHQLSGGMQQRVAIARALAAQPKVLLMDEPFSALDPQNRAKMQQYLLEIWQNIDITILFITHDLDEAVYLSDRVLVLDAHPGRVREILEVPLPRPRPIELMLSDEFQATKRYLESLVHPPITHLDVEEKLSMVQMVPVDSEVPNIF